MTDPEAIYARLASGDAGRIRAAVEPLRTAHTALTGVTLATIPEWEGVAAASFTDRVTTSRTAVSSAADKLVDAMSVVDAAADAYTTMRGGADRAIAAYRAGTPAAQVVEALTVIRSSYEETLLAYAQALRGLGKPAAPVVPGAPGGGPKSAQELNAENLQAIAHDQRYYSTLSADLDARIATRAAELGLDPSDEGALRDDPALADLLDQRQDANRRLENANAADARVREAAASGYDTYVLSYDVDGLGADGTLAIAYGNPDMATNVAVVVPGALTTLDSLYPSREAVALRGAMDSLGGTNATIAWLGYDAPVWDTTVATPDNAKAGAAALVADVNSYRAAAQVPQHITVLGHSYGSVTVGYAAMNGLAADDIAFLGSPGVGASNVDQLGPGAGHVWAGSSEHDPIVQGTSGSWFTNDGSSVGPYDEAFGANQFAVPDESNLLSAHTVYYSDESLSNLAHIATGEYGGVTEGPPLESDRVGELVSDVGAGLRDAGGEVLQGDWDSAWSELSGTGAELLNDVGDVVIGGAGDLVEAGKSAWDNTVGRIF